MKKGKKMDAKQNGSRCKGRTKAGKPCRAAATEGGLCFFHANPEKASELGRIGGRKNRPVAAGGADSLPPADNALAVRNRLARLINDVHSGKVLPNVASVEGHLLSLQLRAIETTDLERRIAQLEKGRAEAEKTAAASDGTLDAPSPDRGDAPQADEPLRADPETAAASEDTLDAPSQEEGDPPLTEEPPRAKAGGIFAGGKDAPPRKPPRRAASPMAKTPRKDRLG